MIQHRHSNGKTHSIWFFDSFSYFRRSRNDHRIVADDRVKIDVSGETVKLTINEVVSTDAGVYELVAENGLGSVDCTAKLTVHCTLNVSFHIQNGFNSFSLIFSTTGHCSIDSITNQRPC